MLIPATQPKVYRTYCLVCGGDAEQLVMGETMIYKGEEGDLLGYGHPGGLLAQALIEHGIKYESHMLRDTDKAPAGEPCSDCSAVMALQRKLYDREVLNGAVYWVCDGCGLFGIIIAEDSQGFAAHMRQRAGILPPNPLTVRFTHCDQHATEDEPSDTIH